jgi:hypothetical protein
MMHPGAAAALVPWRGPSGPQSPPGSGGRDSEDVSSMSITP